MTIRGMPVFPAYPTLRRALRYLLSVEFIELAYNEVDQSYDLTL